MLTKAELVCFENCFLLMNKIIGPRGKSDLSPELLQQRRNRTNGQKGISRAVS